MTTACGGCLRRSWLQAAMSGHIEHLRHRVAPWEEMLTLPDEGLLALAAPHRRASLRNDWEDFDGDAARARVQVAGLLACCPHDDAYPSKLRDLDAPPATIYFTPRAHGLTGAVHGSCVGLVGARRASDYGLEVAEWLGRGLGASGIGVISGLALGIDTRALAGAVDGGGTAVAVLAGRADRARPADNRRLYVRIRASGCVVSETPPEFEARRWSFLARNRIIAALADVVVVVEAGQCSGSLVTAELAVRLGRRVGAVPGRVTSPQTAGVLGLLREGATLIRDTEDVLELLAEIGLAAGDPASGARCRGWAGEPRFTLAPALAELRDEVAAGRDTVAALVAHGRGIDDVTAGLAELELCELVRRGRGGRYSVAVEGGL